MPPVHYQQGGFPPDARLDWRRLAPLIGPAAAAVARYDALLGTLPESPSLLAVLRIQEAVHSSRIENTYASVTSVLEWEAGLEPGNPLARDDIREVLSLLAAESLVRRRLEEGRMSVNVVREAHALLDTSRGQTGSPGEFRQEPVWTGQPGSTVDTATFVPLAADQVPGAMSAWERYIHSDVRDRLVQIAVQHAEFEGIHPFLDGNGRMGRMLIPHLMWQQGLIRMPVFRLSVRIAARQGFYLDRLLGVSRDDDWTGWCLYFLETLRNQAEDGTRTVSAMLKLYRRVEKWVGEVTRTRYVPPVLDALFARPVFRASDFIAATGLPTRSARRLLDRLEQMFVIEEAVPARGRLPAVMRFPRLLGIVEGRENGNRWPRRVATPASVTPSAAPPLRKSPDRAGPR